MAHIVYLRQPEAGNDEDELAYEARLSARLKGSISDVKSCGDEVLLCVTKLEAHLNGLDIVANALVGPSQSQLQKQIQLLRCKLSSVLVELNCTLQSLPSNVPNLRLCWLEQLASVVARLSRAEVARDTQKGTEIAAQGQSKRVVPNVLRG